MNTKTTRLPAKWFCALLLAVYAPAIQAQTLFRSTLLEVSDGTDTERYQLDIYKQNGSYIAVIQTFPPLAPAKTAADGTTLITDDLSVTDFKKQILALWEAYVNSLAGGANARAIHFDAALYLGETSGNYDKIFQLHSLIANDKFGSIGDLRDSAYLVASQQVNAWFWKLDIDKLIEKEYGNEANGIEADMKKQAFFRFGSKLYIPECINGAKRTKEKVFSRTRLYDYLNKVNEKEHNPLTVENAYVVIDNGFITEVSVRFNKADADHLHLLQNQYFKPWFNVRNILEANTRLEDQTLRRWPPLVLQQQVGSVTKIYYLNPAELLKVVGNSVSAGKFLALGDTTIAFGDKFEKPVPVREKSMHDIFQLDVFSDLIGLFSEREPNGLLQTELRAKYNLFRKPVSFNAPYRARFVPFGKAEVKLRFSKLDSKNKFLDVQRETVSGANEVTRFVHPFQLMQYQTIQFEWRQNLAELYFRGGEANIHFLAGLMRSPLRDTLTTVHDNDDTTLVPDELRIHSFRLSPGFTIQLRLHSALDLTLGNNIHFLQPLTRYIKMSEAEFIESGTRNPYKEYKHPKMLSVFCMLRINLNQERSKRFMLRFQYFQDLKARGNLFWQMQAGYSADLNRIINGQQARSNANIN